MSYLLSTLLRKIEILQFYLYQNLFKIIIILIMLVYWVFNHPWLRWNWEIVKKDRAIQEKMKLILSSSNLTNLFWSFWVFAIEKVKLLKRKSYRIESKNCFVGYVLVRSQTFVYFSLMLHHFLCDYFHLRTKSDL